MKVVLRRGFRSLIVGVPLVVAALWIKAYFLIILIVAAALIYTCWGRELGIIHWLGGLLPQRVAEFLRPWWYRARRSEIVSWCFAAVLAAGVGVYVWTFLFELAECTVVGEGEVWCLINKTKYGVVVNTGNTGDYRRTYALGHIARGDIAVVGTPEGRLIERIVALPGDTVKISNASLSIDGVRADDKKAVASYRIFGKLEFVEERELKQQLLPSSDSLHVRMPVSIRETNWAHKTYVDVFRNYADQRCYPGNFSYLWNAYQWGPMKMPHRGDKIRLTVANVRLYGPLVEKYEHVALKVDKSSYYTFKQDYYFVLQDDRDILNDSRVYGPVPERAIIGRAITL